MAESSSSSSEEEEEDESTSTSLRGATSPITAANRQMSGEKRALYCERGYLNSLSRQERRRIKREIRKGRKLGEIVISKLLDGTIYILRCSFIKAGMKMVQPGSAHAP